MRSIRYNKSCSACASTGTTEQYLVGERNVIRRQETNLGMHFDFHHTEPEGVHLVGLCGLGIQLMFHMFVHRADSMESTSTVSHCYSHVFGCQGPLHTCLLERFIGGAAMYCVFLQLQTA